ncbi:uncharacterized protein METZ01_LOCUS196139 [marine metagenome]|uniref:Uncharacterized protein n=1 Tax=marine metagenome TaxID=408172 RepID=A0A382DYG2_9ZZZZ
MGLTLYLSVLPLGCIDFSGGGPDTDKIEIIGEEKSPNGKFIATSFSCSGGGAAGYFYFNASLRKAGEKLDQRDGLLGKHKTWKAFANIEVKWIDDENLEVSYNQFNSPDYKENNAVKVESKHGIKIHYKVKQGKS